MVILGPGCPSGEFHVRYLCDNSLKDGEYNTQCGIQSTCVIYMNIYNNATCPGLSTGWVFIIMYVFVHYDIYHLNIYYDI